MCGVCSGNPQELALGDVVVAEMAYQYDEGQKIAGGFIGDHRQVPLPEPWVRAAQELQVGDLPAYGAASTDDARVWLLERLLHGEQPRDHPGRGRYMPGELFAETVARLEAEGMIRWKAGALALTKAGKSDISRRLYTDADGPRLLPFRVKVGPMASGNVVVADVDAWRRLGDLGVGSILGVDLDAAAIASTAHRLAVARWLVVKGVMDHANPRRDDRFRQFAATAAAQVLWRLLATCMTARRRPETDDVDRQKIARSRRRHTPASTVTDRDGLEKAQHVGPVSSKPATPRARSRSRRASGGDERGAPLGSLTPSQLARVVQTIANTELAISPNGRLSLLAELGETREDQVSQSALTRVLELRLARGQILDVVAAMRRLAETEQDKLAADAVEQCWNRQAWCAPVVRWFGDVSVQQVRSAYYRAVPPSDAHDPPTTFDEAADLAASYLRGQGRPLTLHLLVALLEHETGTRIDDRWFGLSDNDLQAVRAEACVPSDQPNRLVVDFGATDTSADRAWPSTAVGHLYLANTGWRQRIVECEPSAHGARIAIDGLLEWAYQHGIVNFTVGLVLRRSALDELPEAWEFGDELIEPRALWYERPTILHSAERMRNAQARARWLQKAASIRSHVVDNVPEVLWIGDEDRNSPQRIRDVVASTHAACFGLGFEPGACAKDLRQDPLVAAIAAGAPYLLWANTEPPDWQDLRLEVQRLAERGAFADLPYRLHQASSHTPNDGVRIRLIWDEPDMLPPQERLIGFDGGSRA
jgi:nucleoside phosphorylase